MQAGYTLTKTCSFRSCSKLAQKVFEVAQRRSVVRHCPNNVLTLLGFSANSKLLQHIFVQ